MLPSSFEPVTTTYAFPLLLFLSSCSSATGRATSIEGMVHQDAWARYKRGGGRALKGSLGQSNRVGKVGRIRIRSLVCSPVALELGAQWSPRAAPTDRICVEPRYTRHRAVAT